MPKTKRTVYLVTDCGGKWEDAYEYPYMAFDNEQAAHECAEKRTKRLKSDTSSRPYYYIDYDSSEVSAITLLVDELTCENIYNTTFMGSCENGFKCSVCGCTVEDYEGYRIFGINTWNYCPKCRRKVVKGGH